MYGMVNRAIEEMVCAQYGEQSWAQIAARAAIDVDVFVSNEGYPDEMTYALVDAASQVLDVPATQMLEEFGRYWVLHTARTGYGDLLAAGGIDIGAAVRLFAHNAFFDQSLNRLADWNATHP